MYCMHAFCSVLAQMVAYFAIAVSYISEMYYKICPRLATFVGDNANDNDT